MLETKKRTVGDRVESSYQFAALDKTKHWQLDPFADRSPCQTACRRVRTRRPSACCSLLISSASPQEVMEEVKSWQNRTLDAVYPIVYLDALAVKIREVN